MSIGYQCDICGECVSQEADAKSSREVARESTGVHGTAVDLYIVVGADVAHVCDVCWSEIMRKVKAWVTYVVLIFNP